MKHLSIILLLVFSLSSLFGNKAPNPFNDDIAQLAETEGEPSCIVNGSVHVITGSYNESEIDCVVAGIKPLYFERSYSSSAWNAGGFDQVGWRHNHMTLFSIVPKEQKMLEKLTLIQFSDLSRAQASFSTAKGGKDFWFHKDWNRGYTNVGHGTAWGGTNLKNWRISRQGDVATFTTGSHAEQQFKKLGTYFYLTDQRYPNTLQMHFSYSYDSLYTDYAQNRLDTVRLLNQDGSILFGSITLREPKKIEFYKNPYKEVQTSDGQKVAYHFRKHEVPVVIGEHPINGSELYGLRPDHLLTEVQRPHKPTVKYTYSKQKSSPRHLLFEKILPEGRYIRNFYLDKGGNDKNRVRFQEEPAGENNAKAVTYQYFYNVDKGYTVVVDANRRHKKFAYNRELQLLTSITTYKGIDPNKIYSIEHLTWSEDNDLTVRSLYDENNECVYARSYEYDRKGNVIENRLADVITGQNPYNGTDCYKINYTYSNDGFNLLLSQTDGTITIQYSYKKGTDLLEKKFICEGEKNSTS